MMFCYSCVGIRNVKIGALLGDDGELARKLFAHYLYMFFFFICDDVHKLNNLE